MEGPQINALYYPFSICMDEQSLKRMILLFDNIGFIHPSSSGFGFARPIRPKQPKPFSELGTAILGPLSVQHSVPQHVLRQPSKRAVAREVALYEKREFEPWIEIFADLELKGVVTAIDPEPIVRENDDLLTGATLVDSEDGIFERSVSNGLLHTFREDKYLQELKSTGNIFLTGLVDSYLSWRIGIHGVPPSLKGLWFGEESYLVSNGSRLVNDDGFAYLRPKYAAALALNRALITSIRTGRPLVSDNAYFEKTISDKAIRVLDFLAKTQNEGNARSILNHVRRVLRQNGSRDVTNVFQNNTLGILQRVESERLVSLILANLISDIALQSTSLEKVIIYREKSHVEREKLLLALFQWAYEVEELLRNGREDTSELSKRVYTAQVLPEVNKYRETLRKIDKRLVPQLIGTASQELGLSLTATTIGSLLAGLTLEQTMVLGVAIASPILGKSVKKLLDYKIERMEASMDSPVAYLLNVT